MSVDAQDFTCLSLDFAQPGAFFFFFFFSCIWMRIKVSELGMELKMHLEITNSQRFHHFCCLSSELVSAGQSSRVLTAVLESGVVIVEGVTSLLIDKGGKKPFPEALLSSL